MVKLTTQNFSLNNQNSLTLLSTSDQPEILIGTGTHGDEYEIIKPLYRLVTKNYSRLPPFFFFPEMSPSAVKNKSRNDSNGINLNRSFKASSPSLEATKIMEILKTPRFKTAFIFHEDYEWKDFYLYTSISLADNKQWIKFKSDIKKIKVGLFNGIDDPRDPALGYKVVNGEACIPISADGSLFNWLCLSGSTKHSLEIEIPGQVDLRTKIKLLELFFEDFLLQ